MKKIALALALMIVLAGCSVQSLDQNVNAAIKSGNILFKDDFSNPSSGWETWIEPSGSMITYQNGGLRIYIAEKQYDFWSRPGKRVGDVRLEIDAIKLGGPDDNDFGLICRYQDRDNFYAFLASSDGYAGILKVKEGKYTVIGGPQMTYTESIRQGAAQNQLRADCNGLGLTFYINNQLVLETMDQDFKTGEIGLIAGTGEAAGADLYFDNFKAFKP